MALLRSAHRDDNLDGVMCRNLVSVDWRGYLFDCDFNQMLSIPLREQGRRANRVHLADLLRDRSGRQPNRDRRSLLRVHRRAGFVVRRRARQLDERA